MKLGSIVRCLMFISIASLPGFAQNPATGETQQPATQFPPATQYDALARPIDWGEKSVRIFKDSNVVLNFKLATSWIPGAHHEGMFRFKLSAIPKFPTKQAQELHEEKLDTPQEIEKFLARVHKCNFGLRLNDSDGFLLRTLTVSFVNVVDDGNAQVIGLMGNSSDQMDADEYRRFVGSDGAKGSWQVSWGTDCSLAQ